MLDCESPLAADKSEKRPQWAEISAEKTAGNKVCNKNYNYNEDFYCQGMKENGPHYLSPYEARGRKYDKNRSPENHGNADIGNKYKPQNSFRQKKKIFSFSFSGDQPDDPVTHV